MLRRASILLAIVGGLTIMATLAAVPGALIPTPAGAGTVHGTHRAAEQLRAAVEKTLRASSFSEGLIISLRSGPEYEKLVYNAPDRLEIVNPPANRHPV